MASGFSQLSQFGFTRICVARGTVSWGRRGDAPGELQLWHLENSNQYCINTKTADYEQEVCKVMGVSYTGSEIIKESHPPSLHCALTLNSRSSFAIFRAPENPSFITLIFPPFFRQFIGVIKVLFPLEFFL